jgi:hypothetical protein
MESTFPLEKGDRMSSGMEMKVVDILSSRSKNLVNTSLDFSPITDNVIEINDRIIEDVLTRLKFICKVKSGEKIDVTHLQLHENNVWTRLWRTLIARHESRKNTYDFIKTTIADGLSICNMYIQFHKIVSSKLFHNTLCDIIPALNNLKETTYSQDKWFVSQIETLIATLETKLSELEKKYETLNKECHSEPHGVQLKQQVDIY